jgi:type I restriction enzyme R subunit
MLEGAMEVRLTHARDAKGDKAKAMVVTGSRLEAVRYKEGFDRYIKEKELPEKFASSEYQVLLVAEKYQTGFDQPLLYTMYVDKQLARIQAVQTLSRLNRTHPLKEDTFVLDFENGRQESQEAFKQFYEDAVMGEEVDPARLYQLKADLDGSGIYFAEEVQCFCAIFFKPKERQSPADHQAMNAASEGSISLKESYARPLDGPSEVGSGLVREETVRFSRLIDVMNERFGTDFTEDSSTRSLRLRSLTKRYRKQ